MGFLLFRYFLTETAVEPSEAATTSPTVVSKFIPDSSQTVVTKTNPNDRNNPNPRAHDTDFQLSFVPAQNKIDVNLELHEGQILP